MVSFCRISYNSNRYRFPSGVEGKSNSIKTFEGQFDFAWEEWLFNDAFVLEDGYSYGFVQAFQHSKLKPKELFLLNYHNSNKQWRVIAKIGNPEKLDDGKKMKRLFETYQESGRWQLIKDSLIGEQQRLAEHLANKNFGDVVNFRYKKSDLVWIDKPLPINSRWNYWRYNILYSTTPQIQGLLNSTISA